MLTCMDSLELSFYKDLSLNGRINDKQTQLEHLACIGIKEDGDYWGVEYLPREMKTSLNKIYKGK